jgi:hypothetical protein
LTFVYRYYIIYIIRKMVVKVIYMEKNIETYIRRIIELDSKAVSLQQKRDEELMEQEARCSDELKKLSAALEEASESAKQRYEAIIAEARLQAEEADRRAEKKADELQKAFRAFKEDAAKGIWEQLLEAER